MSEKDHNKTITGFPLIFPAETPESAMGYVNFDFKGDIPVRQFSRSDRQHMSENLKGPAADHLFRLITAQQGLNALESGDTYGYERAKKRLEDNSPADLAFLESMDAFREEVPDPSTGITYFIETLRLVNEFGKRFGFFDLPPENWAKAASEISDLLQDELLRRLQRGQPDFTDLYRKLCFEATTGIKASGTQLVFWRHNQQLAPAIYCPSLKTAYRIHTLFISRAGVIGWRVCPWCNEPFEQSRVDQEYCIPKHGDAYRMARMRWERNKKPKLDGVKKRGNTYHADFVVDGQRYRQSLETSTGARHNLYTRSSSLAKAGKASAKKHEIAKLTFRDAAERFLEDRLSHLDERSIQTERERVKPLNERLGNIAVSRITVADVTSYIRERKAAGRANATVNPELDIIRGVLKKAKRWHMFAYDVQPLPVRQAIGRAMSYEEKARLLKVAAVRPEWQKAAWAATLALNTTMRGVEIKNLCWPEVDFLRRTLTVRRSKTDAGLRSIPLNDDAWNTIQEFRERTLKFTDAPVPEHFLFPSCEHMPSIRPDR